MRWFSFCLLVCCEIAQAQEEIELIEEVVLPQWTDTDQVDLDEGVLTPGSSIMGSIALERLFFENREPIEFEPELIDIPEVETEEWPTTIEETHFATYFEEPPASYLIDPQHLLTDQEKRDREGFLAYHARDSGIDVYLYLFDAKQELPEGESVEQVMAEHFEGRGHCVVVFYYLGIPERTKMAMSSQIVESIPFEVRRNAMVRAVEEALDGTEAVAQIESFSVQLSIRLYWLEKELGVADLPEVGVLHPLEAEEIIEEEILPYSWAALSSSPRVRMAAGGVAILFFTGIAAFFGKWFAGRKRIYVFPESEGNLLLEAPHAAGVGAVIAYASPSLPPAVQRDEEPDYLQRM
ncbi:MAG: hypothetical protein ABF377_06105 [Akkermansiaceae bacterium]